ncbi:MULTISPECIES: hypothetical protein [unclassified Streptomyces]|uniref:hypothetical protein n=1 Tax=unclassified Streptomyces TaxID=2593676 RepID=UPI000B84015B|nr:MULTISPECIES: hypothetical protein [unclassified Streptomyces]
MTVEVRCANNPIEPPSFPDDAGADYFIREYRTAVNPARRDLLENKPPLLPGSLGLTYAIPRHPSVGRQRILRTVPA